MKTQNKNIIEVAYVTPNIEQLDIVVEAGFSTTSNEPFTEGGEQSPW